MLEIYCSSFKDNVNLCYSVFVMVKLSLNDYNYDYDYFIIYFIRLRLRLRNRLYNRRDYTSLIQVYKFPIFLSDFWPKKAYNQR
jgi:hypothetical protein